MCRVLYIFLLLLGLNACVSFDQPALTDEYQLALPEPKEKGVSALKFNNGIIDNFKGDIYSWWIGNEQLIISKVGDSLQIVSKNVGPSYTPFGKQITPIDFTGSEAIRIRARATGETAPILRIDLKDVNGMVANAAAPQVKFLKNGTSQYYYFSFKDKWKQAYPDAQKVDLTLISEMMFFINPGMSGYTGKLYIEEIKAISSDEIPKKESLPGGIIDTFEEEPTAWWTGSGKLNLEKVADKDLVKIISTGAGPSYETFGRAFDAIDFSKSPIVKIRAKSIASGNEKLPSLRVAVKDNNGYVANEFALLNTIDSSDFKIYYYDFEGKFSQTYPDAHKVNPSSITEILLFINPGAAGYFGEIHMDYIEVITRKKMEEVNK